MKWRRESRDIERLPRTERSFRRCILRPTPGLDQQPSRRSAAFRLQNLRTHVGLTRSAPSTFLRFCSLKAALLCRGGSIEMRPPPHVGGYGFFAWTAFHRVPSMNHLMTDQTVPNRVA